MNGRERLIALMRGDGASYILAPKKASDPLRNLGTATVPDAVLKNGAAMNGIGLIEDTAVVALDGTNDYVDTGWRTRSNYIGDPLGIGGAWWAKSRAGGNAETEATIEIKPASDWGVLPDGSIGAGGKSIQVKWTHKGAASESITIGAAAPLTGTAPCKPGERATGSCYVKTIDPTATATKARGVRVLLQFLNASNVQIGSEEAEELDEGADGLRLVASGIAPAETASVRMFCRANSNTLGDVVEHRYAGMLLEIGTELSPTAGAVFPTPRNLELGVDSFSGTANASTVVTGPFARGTGRTFVLALAPESLPAESYVFRAFNSFYPTLRIQSDKDVWFEPSTNAPAGPTWNAAYPGEGVAVLLALVFDDVNDTASLYINGKLVSTQATADRFEEATDQLLLGGAGSTNSFKGKMLPFAVIPKALDATTMAAYYAALAEQPAVSIETGARAAKLEVIITTAGGEEYTWSPDEWNAENIPQAITYSSSMPGGYKTATIVLPRRIDIDYADLNLLDHVEILGPGEKILWEGRVAQLPRSTAESSTITVGCVGYQTLLAYDSSFREIYVSRDLSEWTEISLVQKINYGTTFADAGFTIIPDASSARPSLALEIGGHWTTQRPIAATMLDSGAGLAIAAIDYAFTLGPSDANFVLELIRADTDSFTGSTSLGDLATGSTTGSGTLNPGTRVIRWQWFYALEPGGEEGKRYPAFLQQLAWFGNHSVPIQGELPERGVLASDVIPDVLSRTSPLIRFTTGPGGSIQPTNFVIPHLVFKGAEDTAYSVIMRTNGFHLWDWAIWEERLFHYYEPDSSEPFEVTLEDGAHLDLEGDQADDIYNGIIGTFPDASGVSRTVGPPGSGSDYEDASLADTSPTNPINAHGIGRKYYPFPISATTTSVGAIQLSALKLAEKSQRQRRGQIEVSRTFIHPTKGETPVEEMKAGEWGVIADHPADVPRKAIEVTYDAESDKATVAFDNTSAKVDALLEWVLAAATGKV